MKDRGMILRAKQSYTVRVDTGWCVCVCVRLLVHMCFDTETHIFKMESAMDSIIT